MEVEGGEVVAKEVLEGSAARRGGVMAGDVILEVNGVQTYEGMDLAGLMSPLIDEFHVKACSRR